jgi:HPt (histidine-containing phosphotransfer) domain-containing protein
MPVKKEEAPIDFRELAARVGADEAVTAELIGIYREEFGQKMPLLKRAVAAADCESAWRLAHGLKGASGNLSLPGLFRLFYELERAGREGSSAEMPALIEEIEQEYRRLEEFLREGRDS